MFSLELPENIIHVKVSAFGHCHSLRNISLTMNTVVGENAMHGAFRNCKDLLHIFGKEEAIVNALKIRFDGLLIHSKMYYTSYHNAINREEFLNATAICKNGELDPTGRSRTVWGYRLLVEEYPENLIVEDSWRATPLLYAIWGDAPTEIVQFLVNSYQSLYPDHVFEWSTMLITMGRANAPTTVIQNLFNVQHTLSPGYNNDWDQALGVLAEETELDEPHANPTTFCFLTRCSIATRVNAIGVKHF